MNSKKKDLDIILPVHNERNSLKRVLDEWRNQLDQNHLTYQFIICEDGSTDGTKELLNKFRLKYNLTLNQKRERRGYGQAVIDGISSSSARYVLCVDSDGQCSPSDFEKFWRRRSTKVVLIGR